MFKRIKQAWNRGDLEWVGWLLVGLGLVLAQL